MKRSSFRQFLEAVGEFESGKPSGDPGQYQVSNPLGVSGKYQMNPEPLFEIGYISQLSANPQRPWNVEWSDKARQLGVNSYQDFLNQPAMQEAAMRDLIRFNWNKMQELLQAKGKSLQDYLGQTRAYTQGNLAVSARLTVSGLLYGAHSQGAWGMAAQLLQNSIPSSVLETINRFGGYAVPSSLTGGSTTSPTPKSLSIDPTPLSSPVSAVPGSTPIEGTNQNDTLLGSDRDDQILGHDGDDIIRAGAGNDVVQGGRGKDQLYGDQGNDQVRGGRGADLLQGGQGNDQLDGGNGDDELIGVDPKTTMPGQNEQDVFIGGIGKDVFVLGNKSTVFYKDAKGTPLSNQGYAQIQDFNIAEGDVIQLHGKATDYRVGTLSGQQGQAIFLTTAGQEELIALVQGETTPLNLSSSAFRYVGTPSPPPTGSPWGKQFFSPYVDMGLYPVPDLDGIARKTGVGLFNLGFIQSDGKGPAWAGIPALGLGSTNEQFLAIGQEIKQLQAIGGDVMLSFGGAAGTSLAQTFVQTKRSAAQLKDVYLSVVKEYNLSHIDFDIEGGAIADSAAIALHNQALSLLQQSQPGLNVWYTLPVLPSGLTADGLKVVRSALAAGVDIDGVNIMAMDYGDSAAPPAQASMGTYAIRAAENTFKQLTSLYAEYNKTFSWQDIGVTPMIGVNDVQTEVFTQQDAQQLLGFAQEKGLGMLSMWSIARDRPAPKGELGQVSIQHSGLSEAPYTFANVFKTHGSPTLTPASASIGESHDVLTGETHTAVLVKSSDSQVDAQAGVRESFRLNDDWGHTLTIRGFNPAEDRLDLTAFGGEAASVVLGSDNRHVKLSLPFNQQSVVLEGVEAGQMSQIQLLKSTVLSGSN